uniref:oxamate carbamoyltransferase subunit AllH family protein n=1 Tax=Anaerococcus mediterraneensis TaxID=1870984 RepID=UPI0009306B90|nr:DUF2877 domain-containing protein [Anaerococcus mediterraneensis]
MKILFAGDFAIDILKNNKKFFLHSQNSKAIYIKNNENIISLQGENTELGPISLIIEDFSVFSNILNKDQVFIVKEDCLYMYNSPHIFSFKDSKIYRSTLVENKDRKLLAKVLKESKNLLMHKKTGGLNQVFFDSVNTNSFIIDYLLKGINDIYNQSLIDEKNILNLSNFIGVGIGLTPSFDDFLCGFLSAGYFFGALNIDNLIELIEKNLDKTNEISRFFIKLAIDKKFSKAIIDFYTYILDENIDFSNIRDQFYNIGSSSGLDSLFGIYFYCKLCQRIIEKYN